MRLACTIIAVATLSSLAVAAPDGKALYQKQCASCHGANGEGTAKYKPALAGDRSVQQLSKYVQESMPEDNPGSLKADEAEAISQYFHDAFYSPVARDRNRPARVELAHLTVNQYRQSVADLVQGFRFNNWWGDQRGLKAEYKSKGAKALERTDATVNFQWGKETPDKEKLPDPYQFGATWTGSLLAPATGLYEFTVQTEQAMRFHLNDNRKPFIDAWVKSGHDKEYSGTIFLVGGRVYPLKLEFNKANQGVNDPKKNMDRPIPNASMVLLWKQPQGSREVVPNRVLTPAAFPEQYVCSTPFPPDDRSLGWERGSAVTKEWDAATTDAALDAAAYVATKANELAKTADNAGDRPEKLKKLAVAFAERAFRRPLTPEQKATYEKLFEDGKDLELSLKKAVLMALKSPRFLYPDFNPATDSYAVAGRLAIAFWDSLPDKDLLDAAAKGKLTKPEELKPHIERMLWDVRSKTKLQRFFQHWLLIEHAGELAKDSKRFPGFDPAFVSDLRTSLELFVADVAWSDGDFRRLLNSPDVYLNARLAKFYGVEVPEEEGFKKVALDPGQRSGVLTHPFLLASFAYTGESSPIHRGVFLTRGVLGLSLKPPPEAVAPLSPSLNPDLNTRERVGLQTKASACMSCHGTINQLGFTLERFDAVGRFREQDNAKPVDSTGGYLTKSGQKVTLDGAVQLGKFLADSPEVRNAFVEQVFHSVAYQPLRAFGPKTQENLAANFAKSGYNIRTLLTDSAVQYALRPPPPK